MITVLKPPARGDHPSPRVSICVPNLNTRPFLEERFETIQAQTFTDWELLVYDSFSDDGSWAYIESVASREPRMRAWQGPRQGTPGSWTPCVRAARGEYVYIATSDDTMPPGCIEALVKALDANPDCDLAHCGLRAVGEDGREDLATAEWWARGSAFAQSSGSLVSRPHVRRAPFDGLLHLLGGSVYVSITQLLIRRSLFERIGCFQSTWGSVGDFNWSMRAGLVANTVHVPETWGGWRVHAGQATAGVSMESVEHERKIEAMIQEAFQTCDEWLPAPVRRLVQERWLAEARDARAFTRETSQRRHRSALSRWLAIGAAAGGGSLAAREHVAARLSNRPPTDWVQRRLRRAGYGPMLVPISPASARPLAPPSFTSHSSSHA